MTGPEHYREAEKLLGYAGDREAEYRGDPTDISLLAEAQVHATLALAAAAALPRTGDMPVPDCEAWEAAVGEPERCFAAFAGTPAPEGGDPE